MFGRVRAASSTPYDLELERPPSKLVKDDSFSIYEATLMKLKLGAQRDVGPPPEVSMETETDCDSACVANCCSDASSPRLAEAGCNSYSALKSYQLVTTHEDVMMTDTDCSSASITPVSSDCQSTGSLKQQRSNTESILYLFSNYWSSGLAESSPREVMMTDNDGSSVNTSSLSDYQS